MKITLGMKSIRCGCGGDAKVFHHEENGFFVLCEKCRLGTNFYPTESEAIEAFVLKWNGRISLTDVKITKKSASHRNSSEVTEI